ncbi:hypothetical protein C8R42DRAFT_381589 [Lentinula raphanica]|nr:hypothetical protein C8R42DRAFT_381589 [Lentinula raphanica]
MLHFVLRSFSSRALSILLLVVCLLRVAAMDPSPHWDGTMTLDPSNPPRVDIHLGEHYKQSGEHIVLLHFNPDHGYFPPLRGDVPMNQISWTLLGFVQFPSVGHVIYALEQAKKHADKEYQHFSPSNDMNKWWYPTDMMWILHQHYWIDPSTMNRFEDRLPKSFMARRLIRGTELSAVACYSEDKNDLNRVSTAEEAYLWLGDLLMAPSHEYHVPRSGSLSVPAHGVGCTDFSIGTIQNEINIDQVRAYIASYSTPGFNGVHGSDMEKWGMKVEEWRKEVESGGHHRSTPEASPWDALENLKYVDDLIFALHTFGFGAISEAELDCWVKIRSPLVGTLVKRIERERASKLVPSTSH